MQRDQHALVCTETMIAFTYVEAILISRTLRQKMCLIYSARECEAWRQGSLGSENRSSLLPKWRMNDAKEGREEGRMARPEGRSTVTFDALREVTCGFCKSLTPTGSPRLHLLDPWQLLALPVGGWEPKACRKPRQLLTPALRVEVEHLKWLPKDQGSCLFHLPARIEGLITVPSSLNLTN